MGSPSIWANLGHLLKCRVSEGVSRFFNLFLFSSMLHLGPGSLDVLRVRVVLGQWRQDGGSLDGLLGLRGKYIVCAEGRRRVFLLVLVEVFTSLVN